MTTPRRQTYYEPVGNYPLFYKSALETYLLHITKLLYPNDNPKDRIVLANINSGGSDQGLRYNVENFKSTNGRFPFTAYSPDDNVQDELRINHFLKTGNYYDSELDCYITLIPYKFNLNLISFFTSAYDYNRAKTLLFNDKASLTRLYFPVKVNGRITSSCISINMEEPTKGSYTYEFEEQLSKGNIFDIVHNIEIEYSEIIINKDKFQRENLPIPVESVDFSIIDMFTGNIIESGDYVIPIVESTNIVNGQVVDRNLIESIDFVCNVNLLQEQIPEVETIFEYNYEITENILKIIPVTNLFVDQEYKIIVKNLFSDEGVIMQKDFELEFKTI